MNITMVPLIALIAVNFITLVCLIYAGLKLYRLYLGIVDFIIPEGEDKPSRLALAIQSTGDIFARSITAQLKTTFMGLQSGDSRAIKAIEGDIAEDMLGQTGVGALLTSFPALKKTLRRNPQLLDIALGLIQSRMGKGTGSPGNGSYGGASSNQAKFNL